MRASDLRNVLILLALVCAAIEGSARLAGGLLARQGWLYAAESADGFTAYRARRDPLLGWPAPDTFGFGELDPSGARTTPAFPDPATPACVATFGDSFSFGAEVSPAEAYPNRLAESLRCRVASYGVVGYGTDQAYLRYRDRVRERAPVVVLGHFSDDVLRNVNRFRGFLAPSKFGLKPRFELGADGRLVLEPMPEIDAAGYAALGRDGSLADDSFAPGGSAGVRTLRFPYTLSVASIFSSWRFAARPSGLPAYAAFYRADHPSGALALSVAILREFEREARARGQNPVVLLIPDQADLVAVKAGAEPSYAPLERALHDADIETPPLAARLLEAAGLREPCALYQRCGRPAHFTPEGYARLADTVAAWIRAHGLLEESDAPRRGDEPTDAGRE